MATTAAQVLETVQALGYGTDTKAAQLAYLNQVERRVLNSRRWTFLLTAVRKETEAEKAQLEYKPSNEYERIDSVRIEASGVNITEASKLTYITPEELAQYNNENLRGLGQPRYWSRVGKYLQFAPIPDKVYNLAIDVVSNSVPITVETENVQIPDSHIDILVWGIIMNITFRERDFEGHQYARQMYSEYFTEMIGQYGMQQRGQTTHVASSGQWDRYDPVDSWPI